MKVYREEVITEKKKVYDHTGCDSCGAETRHYNNWEKDFYEVNEVTIGHRFGTSYPEGSDTQELELDICPGCFTSRVLPFLRSMGVKREYLDTSV